MLLAQLLKLRCKTVRIGIVALVCIAQSVLPDITLMQQSSPFSWSAAPVHKQCTVPDTVVLHITVKIDKNNYLYQDMLALQLQPVTGIRSEHIRYSPAKNHFDSLSNMNRMIYTGTMTAELPIIISSYSANTVQLSIACSYQGCNASMCFLPQTDTLHVVLTIHPPMQPVVKTQPPATKDAAPVRAHPLQQKTSTPETQPIAKGGMLALLFAFLGGLLTCLTPCVYPLIPVTIGIFGASASRRRLQAFLMSLTYVAGISLMFSALGFILAYTGQVFGQFMGNPWIIGGIIAIFCVFGVSLFGAFNLQLPPRIHNRLASLSGKSSGYKKVFLMGLVAGIIAAPCTGPSLGAILTYVATTKSPIMGTLLLFSFSIGLGLPFLFLGTFAGLLASRPKPGPWMEDVKSALGIVMFIAALYFARPILPAFNALYAETLPLIVISVSAIIIGIASGATYLSYHKKSWGGRLRKTVGIVLVVIGVFALINPLLSGSHAANKNVTPANSWQTDINAGLAYAKQHHKPVIIDYYADWCIACAELDKTTFSNPAVQKTLTGFVRIRVDFTRNTPQTQELSERLGIRGLPVLDFYDKKGTLLTDKRITGFIPPEKLIEQVKSLSQP
jgi:thiol:disulfide interchange protein DsbD